MSGVEIAGLVLGAIPLLIAALEHYETFIGPAKAFAKFFGELDRTIRELKLVRFTFEQSIEVLLRPCVVDDQELEQMIGNTQHALWQDSAIEKEMRRTLGKAYAIYMMVVHEIESIMLEIAMSLNNIHGGEDLGKKGLKAMLCYTPPAKAIDRNRNLGFSRRLKFTIRKTRLKELVKRLRRSIEDLDNMQRKADHISATEETYNIESPAGISVPTALVQANAGRLFKVLTDTWCSTHSSHSAALLLEQRIVRKSKRRRVKIHPKSLKTLHPDPHRFGLCISQVPDSAVKKWFDIEVRLEDAQSVVAPHM